MDFSHELALALTQSTNEFPVDFDDAWRWIGYNKKQQAKNRLINNFEPNVDYRVFTQTSVNSAQQRIQGGRPSEQIMLTIDCFKSLGMMAGTQKGKEIRRYFLECERQVKTIIPAQAHEIEKLKLELAIARAEEGKVKAQERLASATHMLAIINPSLPAITFGQPGAVVEVEVPTTVMVDYTGRPVEQFEEVGITYLAKRYGFGKGKKANDQCRAWLRSIGVGDEQWIEEPSAHVTKKLPRHLLNELDQAMGAKRGNRQFLMGE
ncbi:MAG: hypothetical protein AAF215_33550 [Cyanobacteria bacterium P01_A01_bin.123]